MRYNCLDQRVARSGSPCPSDDCWVFDADKGVCSLRPDQQCVSLTCSHDSFNVEFGENFFGVSDVSDFDAKFNVQHNNGRFQINCALGDCGMTAKTNGDGTVLKYDMQISADASPISVAGLTLYNGPSSDLYVSCEYSTSVSIASNKFEVQAASADADLHQTGDLSSGFHLNLYSDSGFSDVIGETIFIGQRIWARVEWGVHSAQTQVNFYVNNCEVHLEDTPPVVASIVEENCYSSALGVTKVGNQWIVPENSAFTFTSFSSNGQQVKSQEVTVKCDVKLCLLSDNKCNINTEESQCPRAGTGYKFTPNGCSAGQVPSEGECATPSVPCDTSYRSWPQTHAGDPQFLLKYTLLVELEGERAPCGQAANNADGIAAAIIALGAYADNGSGTDNGRDEMLEVIEGIYDDAHYGGDKHDFDYLHPIWIGHGGPARAKPGEWSSNEIKADDDRVSPCDTPGEVGDLLFCYDKVKCQIREFMNYLFTHETNRFDQEFQDAAWAWFTAESGTGKEWPVGGHSLYVRAFIQVSWEVVANTRSASAYKVAKWLYSVDFMKYQVSTEYSCEEPYLSQDTIHAWLSSRPCPNWFEGYFKTTLWPQTALAEVGGNPNRQLRPTVAYPLVEGVPSNYILEELYLDMLWNAAPVGEVKLDHLDYSFSMTKWTILGDHNLDLDNLQQSAHDWLDNTIDIFGKKFWANPDVAAQLVSWSENYTVSYQLLVKYALLKALEVTETRAPCGADPSMEDNIWKRLTEMVTVEGANHGKDKFFDEIQEIYRSEGSRLGL